MSDTVEIPGYSGPPVTLAEFEGLRERFWTISGSKDDDGVISPEELRQALSYNGQEFGLTTAFMLVRMFDQQRKDTILFHEFVALDRYIISFQRSFEVADKDQLGFLDWNQIRKEMEGKGFKLGDPTYESLKKTFDPEGNGSLTLDRWIELCVFLTNASSLFGFYDPNSTGAATLSLDQFLVAGGMFLRNRM